MRHPYLCGFLLALALLLAQTLAAPVDLLASSESAAAMLSGADAPMGSLLLAFGVIVGALVASLPDRLRHKGKEREKLLPGRCAACFAGGLIGIIGCGLAEGGFSALLLTGTMTGTVSGIAFAAVVLFTGGLTAAICERRRSA